MADKKTGWLTRTGQILGILVIVTPLFISAVNTVNLTNDTAEKLMSVETKVNNNCALIATETADRIKADTIEKEERRADSSRLLVEIAKVQTALVYIQNGVDELKGER
jgi:hypothetical protein